MTSLRAANALRDVECTSKHKTLAQVDWSRQLSRDTAPFFVAAAAPDPRGSMTGAERPRRHNSCLDMEKAAPKEKESKPDERDYAPKTYEDFHTRCGVNIGRGACRDDSALAGPRHNSETVVDVSRTPGWKTAKSKYGMLGPPPKVAARGNLTPVPKESRDALPLHSAFVPIAASPAMPCVESRHTRTKGGIMPKKDERAMPPAPDRPELHVNQDAVERHRGTPLFSLSAGRQADKQKLSERYRDMFRTPPPAPMATPLRARSIGGFAPVRHANDRSVSSLLATADATAKRAKKLVTTCFSPNSMTSVRSAMLYSPSPAATPSHGAVGGHGDAADRAPSS